MQEHTTIPFPYPQLSAADPLAESPLSFLETKCPPGPIRVIIGTTADNPCLWERDNGIVARILACHLYLRLGRFGLAKRLLGWPTP